MTDDEIKILESAILQFDTVLQLGEMQGEYAVLIRQKGTFQIWYLDKGINGWVLDDTLTLLVKPYNDDWTPGSIFQCYKRPVWKCTDPWSYDKFDDSDVSPADVDNGFTADQIKPELLSKRFRDWV